MQSNWLWGYFIPLGLLLLIWGGFSPRRARRVTALAALIIGVTALGYWATGYALHLGGVQVLDPENPALLGLNLLYGPARDWGFFGMQGFGLFNAALTPTALALFLAYLPLITGGVLLLALALAELRRWVMVVASLLGSMVVFPVAACWIWGGGWLSRIGHSLELGHGFVDFGGSALLFWLPASMAAGILLLQGRRPAQEPDGPPPAHFPMLASLGALLLVIGWMGWTFAAPFHTYGALLDLNRAAISALLGLSGAILTAQLYAWLSTGELEPLLSARGLAAGAGAALAGAAFVPAWAALALGLLTGLLFPLLLYLIEHGLRLKDTAATLALGLCGGFGVLAVGLFADGRWGQGWNAIAPSNGGEIPVGVAGLFAGAGVSQLLAQLAGLAALGLWGLLWGLLLGVIARPRRPRTVVAPAPVPAEEAAADPTPVSTDDTVGGDKA